MNNKLIIGSVAAKHWFSDFREPKDIDFISREPIMSRTAQHYWIPEFEEVLQINRNNTYLDPDLLLTLKMSHASYDIFWEKTMADIIFFKRKGLVVNKEIYRHLLNGWIALRGEKWVSLKNKTSTTFFEDAVKRKYNHDSVHEAVKNYDRPLYETILKEDGKVSCCGNKFEQLPFEDKIKLVKEEVWVTALERFLVPANFERVSPGAAYLKSLKKLCTTMSVAGGWFSFFMLDNYEHLLYDPVEDKKYLERFKKAERNKQIKLNE